MLGNDIVDLQKAALESNWRRKGYLNKIYTLEEQKQILNSPDSNNMVWLFWSMKEAVYKIINRQTLERFYNPQKFECKITLFEDSKAEGLLKYNGTTYYTKSDLSQTFIYTIACLDFSNFKNITTKYLPNSNNYAQILTHEYGINIQKNLFGVPEIIDFKKKINKPVSISHHGKYLAIANIN